MADKPCTHNELTARVVALEAGFVAFKELMNERDRRYSERANSQDQSVSTALATSDKAVNKAELATEKRLEGLNELRDMASDQAKDFARNDVISPKIETIETLIKAQIARGGGLRDAWGYFAVGAGLVITALAIYFRH